MVAKCRYSRKVSGSFCFLRLTNLTATSLPLMISWHLRTTEKRPRPSSSNSMYDLSKLDCHSLLTFWSTEVSDHRRYGLTSTLAATVAGAAELLLLAVVGNEEAMRLLLELRGGLLLMGSLNSGLVELKKRRNKNHAMQKKETKEVKKCGGNMYKRAQLKSTHKKVGNGKE